MPLRRPLAAALLLSVAALISPSCRSAPDAPERAARRLTLLYTGDVRGVTEPCGCTADVMLGGIDRMARQVMAARAAAPEGALLLDAGNMLAGQSPVPDSRRAQEEVRAEVLADAFQALSYDGVAVGPLDFAFGLAGLRKARVRGGIPFLSANLEADDAPWTAHRRVDVGGVAVGLVGLTDPTQLDPPPEGVAVKPMEAALRQAVTQLRADGAELIVGIGAVDRRALRRLLKAVDGVDLFVRAHRTKRDDTPRKAGDAWIVEPHEEYQSLGRVRVALTPTGGSLAPAGLSASERDRLERRRRHLAESGRTGGLPEIDADLARPAMAGMAAPPAGAFAVELMPVTPDLAPVPELLALRTAFNQRLKEINLASATPPPPAPPGTSGYAGVEECSMCHEEADAFWKTTRHATAMATLVDRDKQFDEECVSCHVTGYRKPGGSSLGHLGVLENVQCESCHGAASIHAEEGDKRTAPAAAVPALMCKTCHNKKHSPKFDYDLWVPKILGPGHGRSKGG